MRLRLNCMLWYGFIKNIMFCLFQTPSNIKKVEILNLSKCFVPWSLSTRITCYNSLCVDFFTVGLLVFCSFAFVL